jgi:hypothetical protein
MESEKRSTLNTEHLGTERFQHHPRHPQPNQFMIAKESLC